MNYKVVDKSKYYRAGVYRHFTQDCKCSVAITSRVEVTGLVEYSKVTNTKFHINFLYVLAKTLNSREDYRMAYFWEKDEVVVFDKINPCHYIFHEDTETCSLVYSEFYDDYGRFYVACERDIAQAKLTREYGLDRERHPNWFEASYISWLSYDALHVELPDGYLFFQPIINWGKYRREAESLVMPVTVRMNHAVSDGYLLAKVFLLLQDNINELISRYGDNFEKKLTY